MPDGGKKRLRDLQRAHDKLPKREREAYRTGWPVQYDHWIRRTGRPEPPPVAERHEMFDQGTLMSGRIALTVDERIERWRRRAKQDAGGPGRLCPRTREGAPETEVTT